MLNLSVMPNKRCLFANRAMALLAAGVADAWRRLMLPLRDGYHPERHYMRGPGPKSRARALEHDPEKWEPVFGKDHAPAKRIERDDDSKKSHHALAAKAREPASNEQR